MSSKELTTLSNNLINSENRKIKLNCKVVIHKGAPVSVNIYTNTEGLYKDINFNLTSDLIPDTAIKSPITKERIIEQINKLGGTPFEFENIDIDLEDNTYLPSISKLNELRRNAISRLENILLEKIHRTPIIISNDCSNSQETTSKKEKKQTSILLNTLNVNYDYSKLNNIDRIYIPLKYFYDTTYSTLLNTLSNQFNLYIYMPSILKSVNTINFDDVLNNYNIKGFVISNISNFEILKKYMINYEFIANYNMNIYNKNTIYELKKCGINVITASPELDKLTINTLHSSLPIEAIVYGYIPVMTTNYCLLSKSNNCLQTCKNNCNNENFEYYLNDRMNLKFRVIPDSFSKTTSIYNSKKISYSPDELQVDCVRFDFMEENIEDINIIIENFMKGIISEGKQFTNGNYNRIV